MDLAFWPRLDKCCCCFSLRTGSLIVGYASLLTSAASLCGVSFSLYRVVEYVRRPRPRPGPGGPGPGSLGHSPQEIHDMAISLYISHAYFILVLFYYSLISLLLVIGVHRNKSKYLRWYCNAALLLLVLASALVVVTLVFFGVVASLPALKWCIILFYCIIVVRSTYFNIEEELNNKMQIYDLKTLQNPEPDAQAAALI